MLTAVIVVAAAAAWLTGAASGYVAFRAFRRSCGDEAGPWTVGERRLVIAMQLAIGPLGFLQFAIFVVGPWLVRKLASDEPASW